MNGNSHRVGVENKSPKIKWNVVVDEKLLLLLSQATTTQENQQQQQLSVLISFRTGVSNSKALVGHISG